MHIKITTYAPPEMISSPLWYSSSVILFCQNDRFHVVLLDLLTIVGHNGVKYFLIIHSDFDEFKKCLPHHKKMRNCKVLNFGTEEHGLLFFHFRGKFL